MPRITPRIWGRRTEWVVILFFKAWSTRFERGKTTTRSSIFNLWNLRCLADIQEKMEAADVRPGTRDTRSPGRTMDVFNLEVQVLQLIKCSRIISLRLFFPSFSQFLLPTTLVIQVLFVHSCFLSLFSF